MLASPREISGQKASRRRGHFSREKWQPHPIYILAYASVSALCGLLHIAVFDAAAVPVVLAVAAVLVSVLPALRYGWRDMPALITLAVGARYAASALFWKTLELDPLDHGLYAPETSFLVVLTGVCAVSLAAVVAHHLWYKAPLFSERYSVKGLTVLTAIGFVLCAAVLVVHVLNIEILGGVWGLILDGFAILPIAWLALKKSLGQRLLTPTFLVGMALLFIASLPLNARISGATLFVSTAAFLAAYRVPIKPLYLGIAVSFLLFFSMIVAPAMTDVRTMAGSGVELDASGFITRTFDRIEARLSGETVPDPVSPTYHLKYLNNQNHFIERAVNIQQLDFVVALAADSGTIGFDYLWAGVTDLLPSAIVEEKHSMNADYVLWVYGALPVGFENHTEVTAFGNAYTYGGLWSVFISMFVLFTLIFTCYRAFCPTFDRSLLATLMVAIYLHFLTASTVLTLISLVRTMPFEILLFWSISRIGRFKGLRHEGAGLLHLQT